MKVPYDEILPVIRKPIKPVLAFESLRDIGRSQLKSSLWDSIQTPNVDADIWSAAAWLADNIVERRPTGVYLGLDTLNERRGEGTNLEIGMTATADPLHLDLKWAHRCERYGDKHLIEGMYELHRDCDEFGLDGSANLLAHYIFFLGYSGLVLVSALEILPVRWSSLFVWGFHDGDLGFLARSSPDGIERLAMLQGV